MESVSPKRPPIDVAIVAPFIPAFPGSGSPVRTHQLCHQLRKEFQFHLLSALLYTGDLNATEEVLQTFKHFSSTEIFRQPAKKRTFANRIKALFLDAPLEFQPFQINQKPLQDDFNRIQDRANAKIIQCEESICFPALERFSKELPLVINAHNLLFVLAQRVARSQKSWRDRLRESLIAWKTKSAELRIYSRAQAIIVCSEVEKELLQRLLPGSFIQVVPNGVSTDYFCPQPAGDPRHLLFSGKMDYWPNLDAVSYFASEVLPIIRKSEPEVRLEVVGMGAGPELYALGKSHRVEVVGAVPDMRPYIARAGTLLAPLRFGAGTRLKILEAFASQKPVVASSIGAEGLDCEHGRHLWVGDNPKELAEGILELIRCPDLGHQLANNGRRLVEQHYDWSILARGMADVYRTLLA